MKPDIHPKYEPVTVTCSCGNTFQTRSALAKPELHVDVCSSCHPFYTGKGRGTVERRGRVERFNRRYGRA
jgi:large subunit ribosomal protein L31